MGYNTQFKYSHNRKGLAFLFVCLSVCFILLYYLDVREQIIKICWLTYFWGNLLKPRSGDESSLLCGPVGTASAPALSGLLCGPTG